MIKRNRPSPWKRLDNNQTLTWSEVKGFSRKCARFNFKGRARRGVIYKRHLNPHLHTQLKGMLNEVQI